MLLNQLSRALYEICSTQKTNLYIYIYINNLYIHPFSNRFSYREIYRYIYAFVFLHVRPCAFFTCYCDKFCRVLCSNLKRTCRWVFFFRKVHAPCNTNLQWRIVWMIITRHTKNIFFNILCRPVETEVPELVGH